MHSAKRTGLLVTGLLLLLSVLGTMTLSARVRVEERGPRVEETVPAPTPEYPVDPTPDDNNLIMPPPECELSYTLTGGPEQFCPGWNLWYELLVTNTGEFPVTNLVISDTMPAGVWTAVDGGQGSVVGVYDDAARTMWWQIDTLQIGETAVLSCVLRTNTNVADGTLIKNTFTGTGFNLVEPLSITRALLANRSICQPTATPTPEPSPIAQTGPFIVCLPVVVQ